MWIRRSRGNGRPSWWVYMYIKSNANFSHHLWSLLSHLKFNVHLNQFQKSSLQQCMTSSSAEAVCSTDRAVAFVGPAVNIHPSCFKYSKEGFQEPMEWNKSSKSVSKLQLTSPPKQTNRCSSPPSLRQIKIGSIRECTKWLTIKSLRE